MKKIISLFSVLSLFVFLSCEESGTIPEQTANFERSEEVNFDELMVIEKGVLTFKDKESFNNVNEFAYS